MQTVRKPVPQSKPLKGGLGSSPKAPLIPANKIHAPRKLLALDTETTGLDLRHGCQPFFVSMLDEGGTVTWYEWDVDPHTREVQVKQEDLDALRKVIEGDDLVLHNTKFDIRGLQTHGLPQPHWGRLQDTLVASHVLCSNGSHKLKDLALLHLDINDDDQAALMEASNHARRYGRQLGWRVANEGDPHFPAQSRPTNGWWVCDTWMPRAVAKFMWTSLGGEAAKLARMAERSSRLGQDTDGLVLPPKRASRSAGTRKPTPAEEAHQWRPPGTDGPDDPGHPWWTVLRTYAVRDVERTLGLWLIFKDALHQEGLWEIYEERKAELEPLYLMEQSPATISVERKDAMVNRLSKDAGLCRRTCLRIARAAGVKADDKTLNSPTQLSSLLFGTWKLKPGKMSAAHAEKLSRGEELKNAKGKKIPIQYSTDAATLKGLAERTEGKPREFVLNLLKLRKNERTLAYVEEYVTRSVPCYNDPPKRRFLSSHDVSKRQPAQVDDRQPPADFLRDYLSLHFNFNPTGTDTTRKSSSEPNGQNIGKQVNELGDFNLRRIFGPLPGREWYSIDYSNIELRIFVYKSGDEQLIQAFEQGYAVHCVFAEILWPSEYAACRHDAANQILAKQLHGKLAKLSYKEAVAKVGKDSPELRKLTEDIFKTKYESTLYQWTKNGNFALIYGAGVQKADDTYHQVGAYNKIRHHLPLIDDFLQLKNHEAKVHGYVRCEGGIRPDRFDPRKRPGYRLYVPPKEPHVAVNYYVQGTAGWCITRATNRCHRYLQELNRNLGMSNFSQQWAAAERMTQETTRRQVAALDQAGYKMILTIHDELVFDFPIHPRNTEVITKIARLMEKSGEDIGLPTPVSVERHPHNWAEGEKVKV